MVPLAVMDEWADDKAVIILYLRLWDYAGLGDVAWPSIARLSLECRMHKDAVRRGLRELAAAGWITREDRPGATTIFHVRAESQAPKRRVSPRRKKPGKRQTPPSTGGGVRAAGTPPSVEVTTPPSAGVTTPPSTEVTNKNPLTRTNEQEAIQEPPLPPAGGGNTAPTSPALDSQLIGKPEPEAPAALPVDDPSGVAQPAQPDVPAAPAESPKRKRSASGSRYWDLSPEDVATDLEGLPASLAAGLLSWWNEARRSKHGARATWTRAAWQGSVARVRALHQQNPADAERLVQAGVESGWQALKADYLQPIAGRVGAPLGGRRQPQVEDYLGPDGIVKPGPSTARGQAAVISFRNQEALWQERQRARGVANPGPVPNPFAPAGFHGQNPFVRPETRPTSASPTDASLAMPTGADFQTITIEAY